MQDIKNEEYVTCPRCEKEVYKDAITCPFCNFGIMVWSEVVDMEKDPFKEYLIDTAIQNIEGKITMKEAQSLIDSYYERLKHGMLSKARLRHWTKRR